MLFGKFELCANLNDYWSRDRAVEGPEPPHTADPAHGPTQSGSTHPSILLSYAKQLELCVDAKKT